MKIDTEYPVFGLGTLLISDKEYQKLDVAISLFKSRYFENPETFILHSSELKRPTEKRSDARNKVMLDAVIRREFYDDFDKNIVSKFDFKLIFCFIRKQMMADKYRYPIDPYHFSFENVLNRVIKYGGNTNSIFAEKRGNILNIELLAEYERLTKIGIHSFDADQVKQRSKLTLVDKKENINGLQFIDLALASITRAALGKKEKMIGNDCDPDLLKTKLVCPVTFFPSKNR